MSMSAVSEEPLTTPCQSSLALEESWLNVLSVSYGGFPVGTNEFPFTSTDSLAGTLIPATFVSAPHASMPLMSPVPFFTMPEKLTSAPITFIVVRFHWTYTPTVRDAVPVVPDPVAILLRLSVPVDVMKNVPLPLAMSSHTGTARTNAVPEVNLTVTDAATVGSVSRFAFTWPCSAAALTSQHWGQKAHAEACAAVYPFAGLTPPVQ